MKTIEELTEIFLAEFHLHPQLQAQEFAARYPKQEDELLEILPMIQMIEQSSPVSCESQADLRFPEKINGFFLEKQIGQGGMGLVFLARQESLNRQVAIKILAPYLSMNEERRHAFEQESQVVANLHHPNIIQVFGAGYENGYSFFAMEFIDGAPLDCSRPHTEQKTAEMGRQIASALAYAHSQNILHRDIKPGNLLVDCQQQIHLGDFGLAEMLSDKDSLTVTAHSREGTIRYMAPEIFLNNCYSRASDQYALGVTLYEFLTGKELLTTPSPGKMIRAICENQLPTLPEKHSDLAVIINKCLSFRPQDRYASLTEVEADLNHYLRTQPIQARRNSGLHKIKLWMIRNPLVATLSGLTGLLMIILLISLSWGVFTISRSLKNEEQQRLLAEKNAKLARKTLARIYKKDMSSGKDSLSLPPSQATASLLNDLLPYYENICQLNGENTAFLADLRKDLGLTALGAGKYDIAEKMFAEAAASYPQHSVSQAFCLNRQALALIGKGQNREAKKIWQQLCQDIATSTNPQLILEGAWALRNLAKLKPGQSSNNEISPLLHKSFTWLQKIPTDKRTTPEFQFILAALLIDEPKLITTYKPSIHPFEILEDLITQFPQNQEYRYELIRAGIRLDLRKRHYNENYQKLEYALNIAEGLLANGKPDANLIDTTAELYEKYIDSLRNRRELIKQSDRIIGIMKLLASSNDENADNAKSAALRFLLKQYRYLARAKKQTNNNGAQELRNEIEEIISSYSGPEKKEFQKQLDEISTQLP